MVKSINNSDISISSNSYLTYNGLAQTPMLTVKDGTTVLTEGTDYTVSCSNNINAGTATATIIGMGNYSGSKTYNFTINKAYVTVTAKSYTINQGDALPVFEAEYSGFKNNETTDVLTQLPTFSCSATSSSDPGAYAITMSSGALASNYSFLYYNGTLTIMGNQTVNLTQIPAQTYGATTYTLPKTTNAGLTITWSSSNTNVATVSGYTLTIKNAGTATITATQAGNSNYNAFSKTYTLTVNKAPLTITAKSYTVKQGDPLPTYEATYSGFKNNESSSVLTTQPTISCAAVVGSAPGTYDINVSGAEAANYEITNVKGTLTITQADPITITAKSYTIQYGDPIPTLEYTTSGAPLSGIPTLSCQATSSSPVGTYTITVSKGSVANYNTTYVNGTLTITKAPLTVTAKNCTIKRGDPMPAFEAEYAGFVNNENADVLSSLPAMTTTATSVCDAGTYDIAVGGAESQNYDFTYVKGTLTITKAPLTITAVDCEREEGYENPEFTVIYDGFINGETADVLTTQPVATCTATAESAPGTYDINVSGAETANYDITYVSGTLTILQRVSYAILDGTTLTFYHDAKQAVREGTSYNMNTGSSTPGWYADRSGITKVVFAPSFSRARPTTTSSWFCGMEQLTSVEGMENLNTSEVLDMRLMFQGCSLLASIDLSHFSTGNVTNMRQMFQGCGSLTNLDLSEFDASSTSANDMNAMFYNCSALTTLTLPAAMSGLNTNACNGVGTESKPCQLVTPDGFDFGDVDPTGYNFQWKGGWFVQGSPVFGDVNRDEEVDVVDVVDIALYVVGTPATDFLPSRADINKDGNKTIADAVTLTNLIIGDTNFANGAHFVRAMGTDHLALAAVSNGFALGLANSRAYTAAQMDVTLEGSDSELEVALNPDRRDGHRLLVNRTGDSTWRVVVLSTSNRELPGSSGEFLRFDTNAGGVTVSDIHFVAPNGTDYVFDDLSVATGIRSFYGDVSDGSYYDLQGRKVKTPARGVYIQNGRKVVRK